jgi:hypothetical protein
MKSSAPSAIAVIGFVFVVLVVAVLWIRAVIGTRSRPPGSLSPRVGQALGVLVVTLVIPAVLTQAGLLRRYDQLPAPALVMIALITVFTMVIAFSPLGTRLARESPLAGLVGFQFFRVGVELMLHRLHVDRVIPEQMTYSGLNFDIVSGIGAAFVALFLYSGRRSRRLVYGWNVLGFALLANIVTIAVLSTPVPFRKFMQDPPNLLPSTFPFVWLPTFLVQAALFGHVLVFRALAMRRRR